MHCPHCGAPIDPGVRFCPSCRKRVVPPSEGFGNTPPLGSAAPPPPPPPPYQAAPASGYRPQVAAALFPPYTVDMRRPGIITAMAVLNLIGGGFSLLGAVIVVIAGMAGGRGTGEDIAVMAGLGGRVRDHRRRLPRGGRGPAADEGLGAHPADRAGVPGPSLVRDHHLDPRC